MRLLHCGDIHLDSRFTSYLSEEKAAERRGELMQAFKSMLKLGSQKKGDGVIIAGDLFDSDNSSRFTRDIVLSEIRQHSEMTFFYLRGNHDKGFETGELPENLCLFGDEWTKYAFKTRGRRIVIAGAEAGKRGVTQLARELKLKQNDINVVVLHGQTRDYEGGNDLQTIPLSLLKDKNIDYLALGHIHEYSKEKLDSRGSYCYCGCLEGRGFDECGAKGAVLLDIDEIKGQIESSFIPMSMRIYYDCQVDITGLSVQTEFEEEIKHSFDKAGAREEDLVKLSLVGEADSSFAINKEYLERVYENRFYYFKIKDMTRVARSDNTLGEASLGGEFLRLLNNREDLTQEQKSRVARLGLGLLSGENIF